MSKPTDKRPRRWPRRLIKAAAVCGVLLVVFLVSAPWLLGWIIGYELHSQLATRMNARLDFSRVVYRYPYGVHIEKAHLLMPAEKGGLDSWVDIGRLDLTLAKLPIGSGPLLIQKLEIENPTVHLSASSGSTANAPAATPASAAPSQKLSDLFQLQSVAVINGRFEYDFSQAGHSIPPVAWGHLNVNMNTLPTSGGVYRFAVDIQDQPVATAQATGSFGIDSLQLDADKVKVVITCDPAQHAEQIPPQGLAFIEKYQVGGQVTVYGNASVPIQSIDRAVFTANVDLTSAHCQPPGFSGPITPTQCSLIASKQAGPCQFNLTIKDQDLASATASGSIDLKDLLLDLQKCSITVHCDPAKPTAQLPAALADSLTKTRTGGELKFDAVARLPLLSPTQGWYAASLALSNGQCQPAGWNGPVSPAKFSIASSNVPGAKADLLPMVLPQAKADRPAASHIWFNSLSAISGNQIFRIDGGEVAFDLADDTWAAHKFHGVMDVGDGPGPLDGANTRIIIPFIASGEGKMGDPNSSVRIALDDGSAVITPNHIHLNRINGMLTASQTGLRSSGLVAKCAEGQVKATVNLDWQTPAEGPPIALSYDGDAEVKRLDLHQLAMQYTTDPAIRQQAFGQFDLNVKYAGSILQNGPTTGPDSAADRFTAQGDLDITHGYFLDIPILRDLLIAMHSPNGSTVGEAAATFDIAHSVVNLDRTGASSPALGIQGSGTITFDRKVDMNFVATPLADWAKDVKSTGLLGDAAAAVIGKAQDVVNGLQRAIYQFRLTGDLSKPKVEPVVVPFLSDKMGPLFQKMASQGSVSEWLKKDRDQNGGK